MNFRRLRRKWRRLSPGKKLGAVAVAVVALVFLAHTAQGGSQAPSRATMADAPASAQAWSQAFLSAIPEPQTPCNLAAVDAWQQAEGGGVTNAASFNPLNTTQPERGSAAINGADVQAFPTWSEGLQANVTAITNGLYGGILSALQAGNNAQAVASAVASSSWGTAWFPASC
jgi:hypothetical protein